MGEHSGALPARSVLAADTACNAGLQIAEVLLLPGPVVRGHVG
jgi:hypothetical protein